jgi:hypothetical protein
MSDAFEQRLKEINRLESDLNNKIGSRSSHNSAIPKYFVEVASELTELAVPCYHGLNMPKKALGVADGVEMILKGVEGLYQKNQYSVMLRSLSHMEERAQKPDLGLESAESRLEHGNVETSLNMLENYIKAINEASNQGRFNHTIPLYFQSLAKEIDSKVRNLAKEGRENEAAGLAEAGAALALAVAEMYELEFSARLLSEMRG